MGNRYLTDLSAVVADAGLAVIEVDGWETRARSSGGFDGDRPWAVMWHHTASSTSADNDVAYIVDGCPDAPVANLYLDRNGTVWICAAGATNTNGKGGPFTVTRGTVPLDSMNTHAVSIEMANSGLGEPWPVAQIDAAFRLSLALCDAYDLDPTDAVTHVAWAPGRKIDPATADAVQGPWRPRSINTSGSWNLDDLHNELSARDGQPPPQPNGSDEMYLATLTDGTVVVVGSAVRPVSGDEIAAGGPLANLPHYYPDPSSFWHDWLAAGAAEYSHRVMG